MLKYWMYSAVLILVPYCIIASLQINVMLGRAMDITDTDLYHAFRCIGLSCILSIVPKVTGMPLNLELNEDGDMHNINAKNLELSRASMSRGHADDVSDDDDNDSADDLSRAEEDAFIERDSDALNSTAMKAKEALDEEVDDNEEQGQKSDVIGTAEEERGSGLDRR